MDNSAQVGFENTLLEIEISRLSPIKKITPVTLASQKFKQIIASIEEIGVIEPLVVNRQGGHYVLLDGHLRLEALKIIGIDKTLCLLAKDDEAFTYNRYISRKAPIQEHRMIKKMVDSGVSEEKIAKTLNINVKSIMQKRSLLDGICEEAIELLKDKMVAQQVFLCLKKMKPTRQIECAMLMIDMNDFTSRYAKGLLAMSKGTELHKVKEVRSLLPTAQQRAKMQEEFEKIEREYKLIKDDRGQKNLTLQFAKNYIGRLLDNHRIQKFLQQNHPDIFEEFENIANMEGLKSM